MSGQYAIVTGGAKNIGLAIAQRLLDDGFRPIVLDIAEPEDDRLRADAHRIDLADRDATKALVARLAGEIEVRCLINNVGVVAPAMLEEINLDDFDRLMHLNVRAALTVTQGLVGNMRRAGGGRIVMNTSRVTLGKVNRTLYSASKGAMQAMARTWALELAADGITVNCVAPGPIATTAFWDNNLPDEPRTLEIVEHIPVRRMGEPSDVANAVSFFCDPRSSFVTGQTLFVCGGVTVG